MRPHLIVIGADKGGVGKTTISRALMDYFPARSVQAKVWDTQSPEGGLIHFAPERVSLIDLGSTDDQMRLFDGLNTSPVNVVDIRASMLSPMLQTLATIGFLDKVRANVLNITVLHLLGATQASYEEVRSATKMMLGARHLLVQNAVNDSAFIGLTPELQNLAQGVIRVSKLNSRSAEEVDARQVLFEKFVDTENASPTLRGYVRSWLAETYRAFDGAGLNAL
jgi:cellulose biosynthesis protein BcsQ